MDWLEESYQERVGHLIFIARHPEFETLCGDRRFADLLRRIGLPN